MASSFRAHKQDRKSIDRSILLHSCVSCLHRLSLQPDSHHIPITSCRCHMFFYRGLIGPEDIRDNVGYPSSMSIIPYPSRVTRLFKEHYRESTGLIFARLQIFKPSVLSTARMSPYRILPRPCTRQDPLISTTTVFRLGKLMTRPANRSHSPCNANVRRTLHPGFNPLASRQRRYFGQPSTLWRAATGISRQRQGPNWPCASAVPHGRRGQSRRRV